MSLWRDHMPAGMFLRSGPDWHLDANGVHTFQAFLEHRGIAAADVDPLPIALFLAYADWFIAEEGLSIGHDLVTRLTRQADGFTAVLASGRRIAVDRVVAATGIAQFQRLPPWSAAVPDALCRHTCDVVDFDSVRGARLLIVGGRQSAYEWAALAADHGAARIDVVHRHATPRFERVSWTFVDEYVAQTLRTRGWWRHLRPEQQQAIARQFWEVGRLTLEPWLTPRLQADRVHRWPERTVAEVTAAGAEDVTVRLSSGESLTADRVVFATGYAPDLGRLGYLADLADEIVQADGFPVLDEGSQSSIPGLYFVGFAATRDFGPFFGFTKGCPAAASIVVDDLLRHGSAAAASPRPAGR